MSISVIRRAALGLAGVTLTIPALLAVSAAMATASGPARPAKPAPRGIAHMRAACSAARPGYARCFALYRPQTSVNRAIARGVLGPPSRPIGLTPKQIETAYRL